MIYSGGVGKGFGGLIRYCHEKDQAEQIDRSFIGDSPKEMSQEVGLVRELRPNLNNAVYHASLSAPDSDKLTNDQ